MNFGAWRGKGALMSYAVHVKSALPMRSFVPAVMQMLEQVFVGPERGIIFSPATATVKLCID